MQVEYAKVSALGDRQENQDRAAVIVGQNAALVMVFDGMGGHSDGGLAAETALEELKAVFLAAPQPIFDPQGFLYRAMAGAHDKIVNLTAGIDVESRPRATGALCLVQEQQVFCAHVGDSRIYHLRGGAVQSRSRDHSHVEVLIQEGSITRQEAEEHPMRNYVESCLGGDAAVPDMSITAARPLQTGDILLCCTDGLWTGLSDDDVAELTQNGAGLAERLKRLSLKSLQINSPSSDNTTGAALQYLGA